MGDPTNKKDFMEKQWFRSKLETYDLQLLRDTGLLHVINREVFHPRGYAIALVKSAGEVVGWTLLGDGRAPWVFDEPRKDEQDQSFQDFLDQHKRKENPHA